MGKTVYFLGSGASKASSGLPVMKGFFRRDDFAGPDYRNLAEFISGRFPGTKPKDLNIEDVITCLELSLDRVGSFGRGYDGRVLDARREFDKLVANRLAIPEGKSSDLHESLMGKDIAGAYCKDTIITVNYDLVVDQTLYENSAKDGRRTPLDCRLGRMFSLLDESRLHLYSGRRPSLVPYDEESGFFLKLHGSLDWLYCINEACTHHRSFFANWIGSSDMHSRSGDPCVMCGAPLVSVLVPPTMMKSFAQFPKLGLLWSLAHRELSQADRIVVFGLSFAPSDYYLRWLFRSAITESPSQPQIFNINTDSGESAEAITELTGVVPKKCQTVDDYHRMLVNQPP